LTEGTHLRKETGLGKDTRNMETAPPATTGNTPQDEGKIRVMLVDDSAVIRGLISRTLEKDGSINIVSSVSNGEMAVNAIHRADPDIVILDIEMPIMDGITALPLLLKEKPGLKVLMCSTLSQRGADISLKALALGATECIAKPTSSTEMSAAGDFSSELLRLIKGICAAPSPRRAAPGTVELRPRSPRPARPYFPPKGPVQVTLRHDSFAYAGKPDIIAIGSSTGGPAALLQLMKSFKGFDVPIILTQHMPKTFTTVLAKHITTSCGVPCHEGATGMVLEKGHVYVAPGGFHMLLQKSADRVYIQIDDGPPENYCKPSVDPMLRSAIEIYGRKILAVILTGMGHDGLASCRMLVEMGGRLIAQDQATSVVWGMPGAVAEAGLCTAVLPLGEIGAWVQTAVTGRAKAN
jgi:two-component system chemotaxis response regulator CheB